MKKLLFVMVTFLFVLTACGGNESSESEAEGAEPSKQEEKATSDEGSKSSEETKADEEKEPSISVDKNLTNVEVTIPQSFFEMQNTDFEQIKAQAEAEGIKDVVNNGDGTITYKMSKSMHKDMMQEMEKQMAGSIEEIKSSGDFPSIKDIKANKSFSKFTMKVDQEAYENSFDGFAAMGVGMTGLFYQLFDGASPDNYQVTIEVVNADTGEVFDTINYPEAFEQMQNME
ncbi:hypothetical protein [Halobacillus sp. BBL2006]|uniref:hypothetical protein n=1 Tax=Halobacillus sp. BBL2006 TaxID=1543706 RepID=UPI0005442C65|nr:hypothetical protein [Halobacillus sp. BBL2006]KHE72654.1 hypothetical protein LD39_03420 [Halobacillus sp. BBL2006]